MPPVILFNKEWRIGSDDFVFSAVLETLCRIGSTITLALILGFHMQELNQVECMGKEYRFTTAYLIIALVLQIVCAVNLCLLGHASSRGSMFDTSHPHPRRHVSSYLYVNCFLTLIEFIITVIGTYFAIKDLIRCSAEDTIRFAIIFVLVVISLTYLLLFIKIICVITAFKPFSNKAREGEREPLSKEKQLKSESMLTYRSFRCLMPWSNDESTLEAFQEISTMLAKIFHDDRMVPSDVAAGLLLLHYKHSYAKEIKSTTAHNLKGEPIVSDDINDLKYFYKYSLAAYGCWWYVMDNPVCGLCSLGGFLNCCPCFPCMRDQSQIVEGDGCFNMNLAAAKAVMRGTQEEFIIFDNRNKIQEVPYFLSADRNKKCLVVSIRGTMSVADMFTDLRAESCPISSGFPEDIRIDPQLQGHKGMVNAARYVYLRLHGLPVNDAEKKNSRQDRKDILGLALAEFLDYSLVVTGHSLGAGTAVILSFILREKYKNRDVKCLAFSPPGGLLSPAAAEESVKFTVSLITGDDVVPRLSLTNIATLADELRLVTEQCQLPKYKLFGHGLVSFLCCVKSATITEELERICRLEGERNDMAPSDEEEMKGRDRMSSITQKQGAATNQTETETSAQEKDLINLSSPGSSQHDVISVITNTASTKMAADFTTDNELAGSSEERMRRSIVEGFQKLEASTAERLEIEKKHDANFTEMGQDRSNMIVKSEEISLTAVREVAAEEKLLTEATEQLNAITSSGVHMYPPGRIVYLEETDEGDCNIFTPDRFHFKNILVSPRMLRDHLPNYLDRLISKL